jgi:hypothetical protein
MSTVFKVNRTALLRRYLSIQPSFLRTNQYGLPVDRTLLFVSHLLEVCEVKVHRIVCIGGRREGEIKARRAKVNCPRLSPKADSAVIRVHRVAGRRTRGPSGLGRRRSGHTGWGQPREQAAEMATGKLEYWMATSERPVGAVGQGRLGRVGKERRWVKYKWWKCTPKRRPKCNLSSQSKHSKFVLLMPVRRCGKAGCTRRTQAPFRFRNGLRKGLVNLRSVILQMLLVR